MARMATFWSLAILLAYGCVRIRSELTAWKPESFGEPLGGITVPIVGLQLSLALLVAAGIFAAGLFFLNRFLEAPKNADLLIETESELRKVTWPTIDETIDGSIVVVVVVLFLMAFMAGADFVLGEFFSRIILGGA
ncbi:MAG: preprotein translocase subunit SecE [Pseudomonadota bacterium]